LLACRMGQRSPPVRSRDRNSLLSSASQIAKAIGRSGDTRSRRRIPDTGAAELPCRARLEFWPHESGPRLEVIEDLAVEGDLATHLPSTSAAGHRRRRRCSAAVGEDSVAVDEQAHVSGPR
jgi:hypothetical protein